MAGQFIKHTSCDECGSKDNMAIYQVGRHGTFNGSCFGCSHYIKGIDENGQPVSEGTLSTFVEPKEELTYDVKIDLAIVKKLPSKGLSERKIYGSLARYYGLRVGMFSEDGSITDHFYPYHSQDGELVGFQRRQVKNKRFSAIGYGKSDIMLQGQELWKNGNGKHLVITEGFLDALSVSQILSGKEDVPVRYPVVSLPSGANAKCIAYNLKWINSFERVVLMFDQDTPGQQAAEEVAKLLDPGKACIAKFSEKDANDMLLNNKAEELTNAFWQAQGYSPAGIISGVELIQRINEKKDEPCYDLPIFLGTLNKMMYGVRLGEITMLTSGTGSGKTQVAREMNYDLLMNTDHKIGICSLEESPEDVGLGLLSLHMDKRVHLPDVFVKEDEKQKAMQELFSDNRLLVLDHQGSSADDDLVTQIKHLIAMGCKWITIDHITIATSEAQNTNKAIDKLMAELLKLAKKFKVHFTVISHLRKVGQGQKNFEEGAVPTLDDLKGSGAIKQISFNVLAFSRNRMEEDEVKKNTTTVHLLKCRYSGKSGYAGSFHFDGDTGRLSESSYELTMDKQTDELDIKPKDEDFEVKDAS